MKEIKIQLEEDTCELINEIAKTSNQTFESITKMFALKGIEVFTKDMLDRQTLMMSSHTDKCKYEQNNEDITRYIG